MVQVQKIDSNQTGLRYQEETSIGIANPANDWVPFEPNSYADFGGSIETVPRNPINADRQRKKGVTTDLDASGGFNTDLTQTNLEDILQGFFFANLEPKTEFGGASEITNVDGTGEDYEAASGLDAFEVGDLVNGAGFSDPANNGLKRVVTAAATSLVVAENLEDETPPATATLVQVGFQFAAGDADIDSSGTRTAITSTAKDMTEFGIIPGEFIFIGGDSASLAFAGAFNNGWARVRSVTANRMEFDKTQSTMVTEASTTETVQIFFGRVLRNRTGTDIVRRTYQLERTLGAPDDAQPTEIQAEYLVGSIANEFTLNIPTAEKVTADLTFVSIDNEQIDGPTSLKAGARPQIIESDAFNTSSDIRRIKLSVFVDGDENPTPLFAFVQELTINITNNASPNKAVGTLGAFDVTVGNFEVGGSATAYFNNVAATESVRANDDVTLDFQLAKQNSGMSVDLPLITLGDARANVEQDEAITLPLETPAATGAKIDSTLNHTMMIVFFDFLPSAAES